MADEKLTPDGRVREDWFGSRADKARHLRIERVFNGIIVRVDVAQHVCVLGEETLVFQDMTQFIDWIQGWHKETNLGARP